MKTIIENRKIGKIGSGDETKLLIKKCYNTNKNKKVIQLMPRRPRLDIAGFHHIVNRGVTKSKVYKSNEDKEKYLEILCKLCKDYKVNIHDYCIMDNHYHYKWN